jgi:phosphoribosylformylglycinamidine synthase
MDAKLVWHKELGLETYDAVILPGGFSYGDYLRGGVIAAYSPIMDQIKKIVKNGKPVLGICNGFQILVESGLLPGALLSNITLKFICKWTHLKIENNKSMFTNLFSKDAVIHMPIAHHQGRYFLDERELNRLLNNDQILCTYTNEKGEKNNESNPNGSVLSIAGICNKEGNVVGLMPHPERSSEPELSPFQRYDGLKMFQSLMNQFK